MIEPKLFQRTVHFLDPRGTVRDWLVTEAWSEPVSDLDSYVDPMGSPWGPEGRWVLTNGPDATPLKTKLYADHPLPLDEPLAGVVEGGPVSFAGHQDSWRRKHTGDDGLVDWSGFSPTPHYRTALAATPLDADQAETRSLRLAATGPAALFVGGECVLHRTGFTYMEPAEEEVSVWLASGTTTVHVVTWQVAFRECRYVVRLRAGGLPVRVVITSSGADERVSALAEQLLEAVGTPRWATTSGEVPLRGPDGVRLRLSWPGGAERVRLVDGKAAITLRGADSAGEVALKVSLDDDRSPVFRELPVAVLPRIYRGEPQGCPDQWRAETLRHAASLPPRHGSAVELARFTLGDGVTIDPEALEHRLWMIEERADCADFEVLGLVHLWHRVPAGAWPDGLRQRVATALCGGKYWIDQPGLDAMCYFTENHQLVWHTAEMLAGEALASIVEFAGDRELAALAAGLLDKLLFTLAVNSWRGVHGSPHGRTYVRTLRSSRWTRRGHRLHLDSGGPFTVDDRPADLDPASFHIDNPFCQVHFGAETMTIKVGDRRHMIDLRRGRRVE